MINVNMNAVWFLSQLAGQIMLKQGYGKIINMASMNCYFGGTTVPPYTAAKHAVAGLTKALSNDWAGRGICVNAIAQTVLDIRQLADALGYSYPKTCDDIQELIDGGYLGA